MYMQTVCFRFIFLPPIRVCFFFLRSNEFSHYFIQLSRSYNFLLDFAHAQTHIPIINNGTVAYARVICLELFGLRLINSIREYEKIASKMIN